jgi:hypothetical protein
MGMFDEIKVSVELPLNDELKKHSINWSEINFQTKDLDNCLSQYFITETGDLVEEIVEREYIPFSEEERKSKDVRPWNIWKEVIEKDRYTKKIDYHGKITFYSSIDSSDTEETWMDFDAYFIYGKLDKILLVEVKTTEKHSISFERLIHEQKEKDKKLINRFRKLLNKAGWKHFWKSISYLIYRSERCLNSLNMFIRRYLIY